MTTKIQRQIEESITEKSFISETTTMINRFIKGLKPLNVSPNELKIVLDLLEKLDTKSRIELIDRLIMLNEFANKLNIKLIKGSKNCVFNTVEYISRGKNAKVKSIDLDLKNKPIAYHPEFPYEIISSNSYINIETINIIYSNVEITENYFIGIKSIDIFAISMQLDLPYFLGLAYYLKEGSKEKTLKIKEKFLEYKNLMKLTN